MLVRGGVKRGQRNEQDSMEEEAIQLSCDPRWRDKPGMKKKKKINISLVYIEYYI